ncbi:E3 ubiquitin-protein ligase TM129 [Callorhinchus milii]|uniref:Transmembrane protein 129, E3 ubiquitin protein ligase n=1 Tax=Callorhinchus milii TaxID=7868 RepID=A0A4W3I6E8_CALMI|nr:E3 ubiquitin-protein ligase TM129 [Callorhinchus milii]|eukprot:gi/632960326/ref/XP_007896134.1/ PREDICTED: transmembrane protein 129 [Callorhinchus milii]
MDNPEAVFSLFYAVFSFCFVFTPTEFRSAGVTVQDLLSDLLGSEDLGFIYYHIRRTTATVAVHSLLPLGYYAGMCIASSDEKPFYFLLSEGWIVYLVIAVLIPTFVSLVALYWSLNKWGNHPIARSLAYHALPQSGWRAVASSVNTEFRRIDKFASGALGARVIVTDTWVMKVTTYCVYIAQQQDIHLTLTESRQHELCPDVNAPVQFLTIRVSSINPNVKPFDIRLNSTEYGELREKLHMPVRNAHNVVIHQSLSDMFLDTFKVQVELNQPYPLTGNQELEACIGCMQTAANIKLVKVCQEPNGGECQQCYCRPMWCLTCLGKWFASRQDQQHPETWLSNRVPCPTCRSKFCILDICIVR